jgi:hypothetical protein
LVTTDLTESDGSGSVTVGLLDTSCGRGGLAGSLGGKLLARSLSSGGLAGGLLGTGHFDLLEVDKGESSCVLCEKAARFAGISAGVGVAGSTTDRNSWNSSRIFFALLNGFR